MRKQISTYRKGKKRYKSTWNRTANGEYETGGNKTGKLRRGNSPLLRSSGPLVGYSVALPPPSSQLSLCAYLQRVCIICTIRSGRKKTTASINGYNVSYNCMRKWPFIRTRSYEKIKIFRRQCRNNLLSLRSPQSHLS